MAAFELRQALRVEIEMVKRQQPFLRNERTAILPPGQRGNEIGRRGQFDIDVKPLFEVGDRAQAAIALRHDLDVDIDRARAPAAQHGTRASREIDSAPLPRRGGNRTHKLPQPRLRYGFTHSDARSKLTSFPLSALYCECAASP